MAGNVERGRYETLATSLVGTPNTLQSLTSEATAMIEVVAPADLPEGYEFEASVQSNNKDVSFTVKVPLGGVESGQRFSVPLASDNGQNNNSDDILAKAQHRIQVPVGDWRDGFFDVCRYGIFHSMACNALCCPQILVAQIMMRMNLTWRGDPAATVGQSAGTYKIILYTTMIYYLIKAPFQFWRMAHADEEEPDGEPTDGQVFNILFLYFWQFLFFNCFTTWIMTKTRSYVRSKYGIPAKYCKSGWEDCCCSFWCQICTVCQMARHTTDYDTYASTCCTETGIPSHVPVIV
mmetsp:Transcript_64628/g.77564  ORF Transcript_64628/g.77564 Transcript_64628/m.77564 type:complete len:292 (-) Transcript_64628:87-962(-)